MELTAQNCKTLHILYLCITTPLWLSQTVAMAEGYGLMLSILINVLQHHSGFLGKLI